MSSLTANRADKSADKGVLEDYYYYYYYYYYHHHHHHHHLFRSFLDALFYEEVFILYY